MQSDKCKRQDAKCRDTAAPSGHFAFCILHLALSILHPASPSQHCHSVRQGRASHPIAVLDSLALVSSQLLTHIPTVRSCEQIDVPSWTWTSAWTWTASDFRLRAARFDSEQRLVHDQQGSVGASPACFRLVVRVAVGRTSHPIAALDGRASISSQLLNLPSVTNVDVDVDEEPSSRIDGADSPDHGTRIGAAEERRGRGESLHAEVGLLPAEIQWKGQNRDRSCFFTASYPERRYW